MLKKICTGFLLLLLVGQLHAAGGREERPVDVRVADTVRQQVADRVEALGTLKAREYVDVTVSVPDFVASVHFEDGQEVKQGQLLVQMASEQENALLQEARSRLEEAQSQLVRTRTVASRGVASQSLLDERQREYNVAKAQLAALESGLKDRRITAPFDGRVGLRNSSPGAYLTPGTVITTLVDTSSMKLDFAVPAIYLQQIWPGIAVEARTRAYGDRVFAGEVTAIDNQVDPVSRSIRVRAVLPNPDQDLKPGQLMIIGLLANPRESLVIPEEALVPEGRQQFVYVVDFSAEAPVAARKEVTIGSRWPGKVEILSGLEEGETVVAHGGDKVRPGSLLKLPESPQAAVREAEQE